MTYAILGTIAIILVVVLGYLEHTRPEWLGKPRKRQPQSDEPLIAHITALILSQYTEAQLQEQLDEFWHTHWMSKSLLKSEFRKVNGTWSVTIYKDDTTLPQFTRTIIDFLGFPVDCTLVAVIAQRVLTQTLPLTQRSYIYVK